MFNKYLIILDDGHGQETAGKRTPPIEELNSMVIRENEFNRSVVKLLKNKLEYLGYNVELSKGNESLLTDVPITTRYRNANTYCKKFMADKKVGINNVMFISIHYNAAGYCNTFSTTCKGGIETLFHPSSDSGKWLALSINNSLGREVGRIDRGIKARTDLGVLNGTEMTAVLVECGFMDVKEEALLMLDATYQNKVADGIIKGINKYLGLTSSNIPNKDIYLDTPSEWSKESVEWCIANGIIVDTKGIKDIATKEVVCVMMNRLYELVKPPK